MNILDYAKYPTVEEWEEIFARKKTSFDKIKIEFNKNQFNLLDFNDLINIEYVAWLNEFNNRSFDLVNNYIMLISYYEMGIPDEEWHGSGKDGSGIVYFPNFKEQHHIYHYWFGFYSESYYTRFFSMLDTIGHLVNLKYRLDVKPGTNFNAKVLTAIKPIDKELYDILHALTKDQIYKSANQFRNDMIHNFRPSQVSSGIKKKKLNDGRTKWSFGIGEYLSTSSIVNNINDTVDLLATIVSGLKDKLTLNEA